MATEGDRWIVTERADGTNVNNWHWTMKDTSEYVKALLSAVVQRQGIFPPTGSLSSTRITEVRLGGEASVTSRKGRTFLIFELQLLIKWEGQIPDVGKESEVCSGDILFPDISPETLDELEVEFSSTSRSSVLSEAMRTEGVACLKRVICACMRALLQEAVEKASGVENLSASSATRSLTNLDPIETTAREQAPVRLAGPSAVEALSTMPDVPRVLVMGLRKMVSHPTLVNVLRFGCCKITDEHVPSLAAALAYSECAIQVHFSAYP